MTRLPVRVIAATTFVLFGLLLGSLSSSTLAAGHAVSIADGAFRPGKITIKLGDSITWTNHGYAMHDVSFDAFHSETLSPGKSYPHKFTRAGSFAYVCSIHGFSGTVVVRGAAPTPKPTATPRPTANAPATPTAAATPTALSTAVAPTPSPVAIASIAVASPSPAGGTSVAQDSGGASSTKLPLVFLGVLLVAGLVAGLRLNRRRR